MATVWLFSADLDHSDDRYDVHHAENNSNGDHRSRPTTDDDDDAGHDGRDVLYLQAAKRTDALLFSSQRGGHRPATVHQSHHADSTDHAGTSKAREEKGI